MAGGINTYTYALNNPLLYTDPAGTLPFGLAIKIATGVASVYGVYSYVDEVVQNYKLSNETRSDRIRQEEEVMKFLEGKPNDAENAINKYNDSAQQLAKDSAKLAVDSKQLEFKLGNKLPKALPKCP